MSGQNGDMAPVRSKRKVKAVNYSDDNAFDQMQERANEAAAAAVSKPGARRNGAAGNTNGSNGNGTSSGTANGGGSTGSKNATKGRRDDVDDIEVSFPMNWQRRLPAGEKQSAVVDFEGSELHDDGRLHLKDGSTLGPDGKCYKSACWSL